jgi:nucleoside-diphosphate-sugar epimerase
MANELIAQLNPQAKIVGDGDRLRPSKSEVNRLLGCNKKILALTNWQPQYDLAKGLAETIEWFRKPENLAQYKTNIYNV